MSDRNRESRADTLSSDGFSSDDLESSDTPIGSKRSRRHAETRAKRLKVVHGDNSESSLDSTRMS